MWIFRRFALVAFKSNIETLEDKWRRHNNNNNNKTRSAYYRLDCVRAFQSSVCLYICSGRFFLGRATLIRNQRNKMLLQYAFLFSVMSYIPLNKSNVDEYFFVLLSTTYGRFSLNHFVSFVTLKWFMPLQVKLSSEILKTQFLPRSLVRLIKCWEPAQAMQFKWLLSVHTEWTRSWTFQIGSSNAC